MEKFRAYVINLDRRTDRWRRVRPRLDKLRPAVDVARLSAFEDSTYPHLGNIRSHKSIVAMARKEQWPMVLAMEDDIVLTDPVGTIELLEFLQIRLDWYGCW